MKNKEREGGGEDEAKEADEDGGGTEGELIKFPCKSMNVTLIRDRNL
jgi:hypothetical protein